MWLPIEKQNDLFEQVPFPIRMAESSNRQKAYIRLELDYIGIS